MCSWCSLYMPALYTHYNYNSFSYIVANDIGCVVEKIFKRDAQNLKKTVESQNTMNTMYIGCTISYSGFNRIQCRIYHKPIVQTG